jgi:crossover junction endodeoxyribonuclease RuvC
MYTPILTFPRRSLKLQPNSRVILGVDPGLATTGWGVIEEVPSGPRLISFGAIETPASQPLPDRLLRIQSDLAILIRTHQPYVLAIEELFFTKFAVSIAATAQARGAILLTAALQNLSIVEYNPRAVKMAMTGFGSASKIQLQTMIQRHFSLVELPKPDDAADALAIALCHAQTKNQLKVRTSRKSRADFEKNLAIRAGVA